MNSEVIMTKKRELSDPIPDKLQESERDTSRPAFNHIRKKSDQRKGTLHNQWSIQVTVFQPLKDCEEDR
jgi:hypothetical protein